MRKHDYMNMAIELARKGAGRVAPNPMVGAVIVKDGEILGRGYHTKYGESHAEVEALNDCRKNGADPTGATMYVTLEPCRHFGKTPPCTDAIAQSGLKRVVIGVIDPNKQVAGKGVVTLRESGVDVEINFMEDKCRKLNEIYFHNAKRNTPFVAMKYAITADGKIATKTGSSKWITSEKTREYNYRTRCELTGVMTGVGTVLADDPFLTSHGFGRDPVVIVCDSALRTPLSSRIMDDAKNRKIIIATLSENEGKKRAFLEKGAVIINCAEKKGRVDLADLMVKLRGEGVDSVLLEGGGSLNYSALAQGIVNKLSVFVGPSLFGGADSLTPVEGAGVNYVSDGFRLKLEKVQKIGDDVLIDYILEEAECLPEL
ncbi:MAG: bifunctional diaminohydroxyphosphoribosylaminopyrimidine deaminase/5-amino-6-(5-phosphoribosylamino)uracil reductase RibD [Clostridiales bacterium]|jgi:diaminohydroxyphosphoribosylaminopyrimidine deaminase/5-amino-6-(5-phosphoribosylamino)uracil reductase|nr:bifunctional diaminohydroxyphosphoribosylaminopyrimidine deaminase/5-amino-6-(5-phosphoribosylamino)uracil reductase RibD [Clostridiales bacterium]